MGGRNSPSHGCGQLDGRSRMPAAHGVAAPHRMAASQKIAAIHGMASAHRVAVGHGWSQQSVAWSRFLDKMPAAREVAAPPGMAAGQKIAAPHGVAAAHRVASGPWVAATDHRTAAAHSMAAISDARHPGVAAQHGMPAGQKIAAPMEWPRPTERPQAMGGRNSPSHGMGWPQYRMPAARAVAGFPPPVAWPPHMGWPQVVSPPKPMECPSDARMAQGRHDPPVSHARHAQASGTIC